MERLVKDGKTYEVNETMTKWVIQGQEGKMTIKYELDKKDFETLEEVERYFSETDI